MRDPSSLGRTRSELAVLAEGRRPEEVEVLSCRSSTRGAVVAAFAGSGIETSLRDRTFRLCCFRTWAILSMNSKVSQNPDAICRQDVCEWVAPVTNLSMIARPRLPLHQRARHRCLSCRQTRPLCLTQARCPGVPRRSLCSREGCRAGRRRRRR